MAQYTTIGLEEARQLMKPYDCGEVLELGVLAGGQANSSYRVRTQAGEYVLSICDEKPEKDVLRLARILLHLERHGLETTRIVTAANGDPVGSWDGKPVLVKQYIAGRPPETVTPDMAFQLGREMARLHRLPFMDDLEPFFSYGRQCFDEVIPSRIDPAYGEWLRDVRDHFNRNIITDLPRALVHGDVFHDNTVFDNGRLVAIIDFEEACWYYRVFDLGMCGAGACTEDGLVSLDKVRAMVEGYESEGQLTSDEKTQLQIFIEYGAAATGFWRFRQFNMVNPIPDKAGFHGHMDRLVDQMRAMPEEEFQRAVFGG